MLADFCLQPSYKTLLYRSTRPKPYCTEVLVQRYPSSNHTPHRITKPKRTPESVTGDTSLGSLIRVPGNGKLSFLFELSSRAARAARAAAAAAAAAATAATRTVSSQQPAINILQNPIKLFRTCVCYKGNAAPPVSPPCPPSFSVPYDLRLCCHWPIHRPSPSATSVVHNYIRSATHHVRPPPCRLVDGRGRRRDALVGLSNPIDPSGGHLVGHLDVAEEHLLDCPFSTTSTRPVDRCWDMGLGRQSALPLVLFLRPVPRRRT